MKSKVLFKLPLMGSAAGTFSLHSNMIAAQCRATHHHAAFALLLHALRTLLCWPNATPWQPHVTQAEIMPHEVLHEHSFRVCRRVRT